MKDCVEYQLTGDCKVDIDKVVKRWNMMCRVSKSGDIYRLMQYTPKGKCILKCQISESDAFSIINRLGLVYVQSPTFKRCGTYLR
ncbi:MAG: hypothetical protein IJZ36_02875 [Bacilli bacterium]|nr:hypothetical protein [Bacilli bacterium]